MHLSAKKLFLIGFIFLLLVGIPASVYLVQQQQETRSRAAPATNLSFTPDSSQSSPIAKNVGDIFPLDIMVDPGTNVVTLVKMEIDYDPDKLELVADSFQVNSTVFPTVSAGPVYSPGKIVVTISAGFDATKAVQIKQQAATVKFKALAKTDADSPTRVTFSAVNTLVTSLGSSDQASENVFAGSLPAIVSIAEASTPTGEPTAEPTTEPTAEPTEEPTDTGTNPVCSSLSADTTSGEAPLEVTFTAAGTSTDPNVINKVTFNFGDGQVSDVTTDGGIGSNSANTQVSHTYSTAGTFQASAILTDSANAVSDTTNCAQTISVAGATTSTEPATPTPTIAPTGPTEIMFGIGAAAGFLMIGGALLFFLL